MLTNLLYHKLLILVMIISKIKELALNRNVFSLIIGSVATFFIFFYKQNLKRLRDNQSAILNQDKKSNKTCLSCPTCSCILSKKKFNILLFYGSQTGTVKRLAHQLLPFLQNNLKQVARISFYNIKDYDPETNFLRISKFKDKNYLVIILVSTHQDGQPPDNCKWFFKWLEETAFDFRFDQSLLQNLNYCIFGVGDSSYNDTFCQSAKNLETYFSRLSAKQFTNTYFCDTSVSQSTDQQLQEWSQLLVSQILEEHTKTSNEINNRQPQYEKEEKGKEKIVEEEEEEDVDEKFYEDKKVVDIEDVIQITEPESNLNSNNLKEMINPKLRKELSKQGYKLIGSHSGVKLCRWTKSMLRGRGGCYKHTFYGIESHRCMEATPSLACANKCVFCWRHHTNPVGTHWKWLMDEANFIVKEAIKNHTKMINEFKGAPGVISDRFHDGMNVKHCALSLVGEPIMYPKINLLIRHLHEKRISTFLVTNAQFPEAIENLEPVTQLYVSIDASSEKSLKKIDRPLFKDFWRRLLDSLKAISKKKQRTVYRLTLVKSWNDDEIDGYAKLILNGNPDFIEVKGVTYCGTGKDTKLTMDNVPWHAEVVNFVDKLVDKVKNEYEIASEHEHSNCVLVAKKSFKINGKWRTWIDYEKFQILVDKYYQSSGKFKFTSLDYACELPQWAVRGAEEKGFDPLEKRHFRKNKQVTTSITLDQQEAPI